MTESTPHLTSVDTMIEHLRRLSVAPEELQTRADDMLSAQLGLHLLASGEGDTDAHLVHAILGFERDVLDQLPGVEVDLPEDTALGIDACAMSIHRLAGVLTEIALDDERFA